MDEIEGRFFDYRPFGPRDPEEEPRAATPLELFFDLVFVIAIASVAAQLHHGIADNHAAETIPIFLFAFLSIWWAWMNYTWFASAYDNDGPLYRLLTFWIMSGALLLAASIPLFFDGFQLALPVFAYVLMRMGMIALWLIAARNDPAHRKTALRYALGIGLVQFWWVAAAIFGEAGTSFFIALLLIGWLAELLVPVFAERVSHTPWHSDHIVERYGLLMIIMLGEILLAVSMALTEASEDFLFESPLLKIAISAAVIAFSMWWLYFSRDDHAKVVKAEQGNTFLWGYGHCIPFCGAAAVGAGIGVMVDVLSHHAEVGLRSGYIAVAIPLAAFMFGLWLIRDRLILHGYIKHILLLFAVLVLIAGFFLPAALVILAAISATAVLVRGFLVTRECRKAAARMPRTQS